METENKNSFIKALCEALKKIEQPKHDSKVNYGKTQFSYASLKEVLERLKPLNDHGIRFTQSEVYEDGLWFMNTIVSHEDGYSETHKTFLKNSTTSEKEFASSITYSRRYSLCSIFGLYGQKDTDCVIEEVFSDKKQVEKFISKKLQDDIQKKMGEDEVFKNKVYDHISACKVPNVQSIPATKEEFYRSKINNEATNAKAT